MKTEIRYDFRIEVIDRLDVAMTFKDEYPYPLPLAKSGVYMIGFLFSRKQFYTFRRLFGYYVDNDNAEGKCCPIDDCFITVFYVGESSNLAVRYKHHRQISEIRAILDAQSNSIVNALSNSIVNALFGVGTSSSTLPSTVTPHEIAYARSAVFLWTHQPENDKTDPLAWRRRAENDLTYRIFHRTQKNHRERKHDLDRYSIRTYLNAYGVDSACLNSAGFNDHYEDYELNIIGDTLRFPERIKVIREVYKRKQWRDLGKSLNCNANRYTH